MRFLALLIVLAIIAVVLMGRNGSGPFRRVEQASAEADAVAASAQTVPMAAGGETAGGLRRPIDQTRAVIDRVRKQRAEEDF